MKRLSVLSFVLAIFTFNVYAVGFAEKVTGEFTLNDVYYRVVSAHEATSKHPQKGFFYSWQDSGRWYEIDFSDTHNTCVNVHADGAARIGGLVTDGNEGDPAIGRYFGFDLLDGGEGQAGLILDYSDTYRVSTDYDSEVARLALLEWCASGTIAGLTGEAYWGHSVTEGNLQVHNSKHSDD